MNKNGWLAMKARTTPQTTPPSPAPDREALYSVIEELDGSWHDEGDHIEWDEPRLVEGLIALRRAYAALSEAAPPSGALEAFTDLSDELRRTGIAIAQYPPEYERAGQWTAIICGSAEPHGNGATPTAAFVALLAALSTSEPTDP